MNIVYLLGVSLVACESPAFAYLDGGAASMLLQLIFGGVAGGFVFLKVYWKKIFSSFRNK